MSDYVWEKRKSESTRAYRAFCVYRDMGADRSLSKVREKLGRKSGYERQLQEWSSNHEWVNRVAAYDEHLEMLLRADLETRLLIERRKQIERELEDTENLLGKYDAVFNMSRLHVQQQSKLVDEVDANGKPTGKKIEVKTVELNIADWQRLTGWLDDIHTMRRRALNMPQKIAQSWMTGEEGEAIKLDVGIDDLADVFREMGQWEKGKGNSK